LKVKRFYGWINLLGLMLVYGSLCGTVTYAYGVFLPAMSEAFDWSRSALSGPYALFFITGGMLGPVAGMTIARFGARKNIIACNSLVVLGLLGMSQVGAIWHIYLFFGVMAGVSIAFGEFIPITTVINNWFIRKRSLAMGLLFASGGVGGFAMPPMISWFILGLGWRWAWVCLAAIHLLLSVMIGGMLIRGRPEDVGQKPDGRTGEDAPHDAGHAATARVYQTQTDWTVGEALRSSALWMLIALFAIILFVLNMLTTHQVAYLQDLGFSPMVSATALGMMLGASIIGRLMSGFLGMRFEGRHLAVFFLMSMGSGVLFLMYARSIYAIYLYSALTGIGFGGMIVLMPNILGAFFGRTHYARIVGWTTPVVTLASAVSPNLAGAIYDATGEYTLSFGISVTLIVAGIVIALRLRPRILPPGMASANSAPSPSADS
jgi:MFS family permease